MIAQGRAALAAAIAAALGEAVTTSPTEPDAVAAPAAWLTLAGGAFQSPTGFQVIWDLTLCADVGRSAADAQGELDAMADLVLAATLPGVAQRDVTWRADATVRIGEVAHPALVITLPQTDLSC